MQNPSLHQQPEHDQKTKLDECLPNSAPQIRYGLQIGHITSTSDIDEEVNCYRQSICQQNNLEHSQGADQTTEEIHH